MEIQTSTVGPRLDSIEENDSKKSQHQYDAVKMRYFLSLGMNRPPQMASSVPTTFSTPSVKPTSGNTRQRTKTSPSKTVSSTNSTSSIAIEGSSSSRDHRKRAISHPIPIGFQSQQGISIPGAKENTTQFEEGEENSEDELNLSLNSSEGNGDGKESEGQSAEEEEENFKIEEENTLRLSSSLNSASPDHQGFIPPHEMLKLQKTSKFDVGTAQSVAVWEQRRRKYI